MNVSCEKKNDNAAMLLKLDINDDGYDFASDIKTALDGAEKELSLVSEKLEETIISLKKITPECDKTDYMLSVSIGAICGMFDIFLVGKPGETTIGEVTDKWFENRTKDFAKMCGWNDKDNGSLKSAITCLERKFDIPYDQVGIGGAGKDVYDLKPENHHFKSLGHNPTLLGLFFSILDQYRNRSHFISDGELITLEKAKDKFELRGNNVPGKLFCGFVNWFGHLISDMSGSSSSKGRGMGIPSPLWCWTNDIIAIKRLLNIPVNEFDKTLNELALSIYKQGYDARFQATQVIPVFVNELLVRVIYSVRRMINYYINIKREDRNSSLLWESCEPFTNATVKRMLTVAHGTFCMIDAGDAIARGLVMGGGSFNVVECFMRLNIVGIGRFTISLYGETSRAIKRYSLKEEVTGLHREKIILDYYINGLKYLAVIYNDESLLLFSKELKESDMYIQAFEKTVRLAEIRSVPQEKILRNKADIDSYFMGGNM